MDIKVLRQDNDKSVIQWTEGGVNRRGIIPAILVNGNYVDDSAMSLAIPYGIDFESILDGNIRQVSAMEYTETFHNVGIWTKEDIRRNPQAVQGAILSASGLDFQTLMRLIESSESSGGKHG